MNRGQRKMRGNWRGRGRGRGSMRGHYGPYRAKMFLPPGPSWACNERTFMLLSDARCTMVRGFPPETSPQKLRDFFAQFAEVKDVTMHLDNEKGSFAVLIFASPEGPRNLLKETTLQMDGQLLDIMTFDRRAEAEKKQLALINLLKTKPEQTVYARGFLPKVEHTEIEEFFTQFGAVEGVLRKADPFANNFVYVFFSTSEDAEKVIALKTLDYDGKKITVDHKWSREELMAQRKLNYRQSVYVHGFTITTKDTDIKTAFEQFGTVENVFIGGLDTPKGPYALVEFDSPETVDKVMASTDLKIGEQAVTIKRREQPVEEEAHPGGKPPPSPASKAAMAHFKAKQNPKVTIHYKELIDKLKACSCLEDQMMTLVSELELSEEDYTTREEIATSLANIFQDFFPGCETIQFGSSVNGFGVRGTDMDIFLDLKLTDFTEDELAVYPKKELPYTGDIAALAGTWDREKIKQCTIHEQMKLVSRILSSHGGGVFNHLITIPCARMPVLKFLHEPTGMSIDLTISNKLALNNTRMVQYFAEFDPRMRPLFYALRFWGKMKDVIGNVMNGPHLSNYALALLAFIYLANCSPPILPTVQQLSDNAAERTEIDGWDCSMSLDSSLAPNADSLADTLVGFFKYYTAVDFTKVVLLARTAMLVDRQVYEKELSQTTDERFLRIKRTPMVVMDPFVLNHNVSANVNMRTLVQFSQELQQVVAKIDHEGFLKKADAGDAPEKDWGLTFLISRERVRVKTMPSVSELRQYNINLLHLGTFNVPVNFKVQNIPYSLQTTLTPEELQKRWCTDLCNFILTLMKDLLAFELTDASDLMEIQESEGNLASDIDAEIVAAGNVPDPSLSVEAKRLKVETIDRNSVVTVLKCSTLHRMWTGRKSLKKELRVKTGINEDYKLEEEVTNHLLSNGKPALDAVIEMYLTVTLENCSGLTMLRVNLFPTTGSKEFTCFFSFFSAFVTRLCDKSFTMKV